MGHLHQYGTECIIVDDAHDLSLEHLMFIKEITDQGRLQYNHPLGLCLVAAGHGQMIPLKETLDLPDPTWLQFRRQLDLLQPFCRIAGYTSEEVRDILAELPIVYRELFPHLNQRQWSGFIYQWLTQSHFDPTHSGAFFTAIRFFHFTRLRIVIPSSRSQYWYTMVRSILRSVGLTSMTRKSARTQSGKRENATSSPGLNSFISSSFGSSCLMSWGSSRPHL
jgi:hypothetical protein